MATRKTTAAKSATASKSTRPDPAADMQAAMARPLKGMAEGLEKLKLSGAAKAILENGRKDLAVLVKANEKSYQGLQAVVQRQTEMLRSAIGEWQGAVTSMPGKDPKENLAKLDELGKAAFQRALDDIRELAELAAKSQSDAFEIVRQRITDNVDQVRQLLSKSQK